MRDFLKSLTRVIALVMIWGITNTSYADNDNRMKNVLTTIQETNVVGMGFWDTGDEKLDKARDDSLLCIVIHSFNAFGEPEDILMFWGKYDQHWLKHAEYHIEQGFDAMFTLPFNQHLVTYWLGASYFTIRVFSIVDHHIQVTLEKTTGCGPEFLDIDHDGIQEIILCTEPRVIQRPESASIYRWDGKQYTLLKTVPWENRLCKGGQRDKHPETRE